MKVRVKKTKAGENGRHQTLRIEGQPLKVFQQEVGVRGVTWVDLGIKGIVNL